MPSRDATPRQPHAPVQSISIGTRRVAPRCASCAQRNRDVARDLVGAR